MTKIYRQGDVLIRQVEEIPEGLEKEERDNGRVVLAYGEVTNHCHAIHGLDAAMFRDQGLAKRFLEVTSLDGEPLTHEEHDTIVLPKGKYEIIIQKEYQPGAVPRQVQD